MQLFTFFYGPLGWILKFVWKATKKYGWLLLIVLYVFRHTLVSDPLCRWLEKKINSNIERKIKIEKIRGTYFTNISFQNISLSPTENLLQCTTKEIRLSYNILAPLFGKRFFQEIYLDSPNIQLHIQDDAQETKSIDFSDIAWQVILENGPDVAIRNATLEYEQKDRKIVAKDFTFCNSPKNGSLEFSSISWQDSERQQSARNFGIFWKLENRVLTIEKMKFAVQGYTDELELFRPFQIDLRNPKITQGQFEFPLPDGGHLRGKMDVEEGCYWELSQAKFAFKKVVPWLKLVRSDLPESSGYLHLHAAISWPKWDIAQLQGYLGLGIANSINPIDWEFPHTQKGVRTEIRIEDITLLLPWLQYIFPTLEEKEFGGKITIQQNSNLISETAIESTGSIHSPNLKILNLPSSSMEMNWDILSDWENKKLQVKHFSTNFLQNSIRWEGESELKDTFAYTQLKGNGEGVLPTFFQSPVQANWKSEWQIQAKTETEKKENFEIRMSQTIHCSDFRAYQYSFPKLQIRYDLLANSKELQIQDFFFTWKESASIQGKCHIQANDSLLEWQNGITGNATLQLFIPKIEQEISRFIPEFADIFSGDLNLQIVLQNVRVESMKKWEIIGEVTLLCSNGTIQIPLEKGHQKISYQKFQVQVPFRINEQSLSLPNWKFSWEDWLQCTGKIALPSFHESKIAIDSLQVMWQKEIITQFSAYIDYREKSVETKGQFQLLSPFHTLQQIVWLPIDVEHPIFKQIGQTNIAWKIQANMDKQSEKFGAKGSIHAKIKNAQFSQESKNLLQNWNMLTIQLPFSYNGKILETSSLNVSSDLGIYTQAKIQADLEKQTFVCGVFADTTKVLKKVTESISKDIWDCKELLANLSLQGSWRQPIQIAVEGKIQAKKGTLYKVPFSLLSFVSSANIDDQVITLKNCAFQHEDVQLLQVFGKIASPATHQTRIQINSDLAKFLRIWGEVFFGKDFKKEWKFPPEIPLQIDWQDELAQIANAKFTLSRIRYQDWQLRDISIEGKWDQIQETLHWQVNTLVNGGKLHSEGAITLPKNPIGIRQFQTKVTGHKVLVFRNEQISSRANIDLLLQGKTTHTNQTTAKLSGQIEIVDLEIRKEISLQQSGERIQFDPGVEIPGLDLALDIVILFPKISVANSLIQFDSKGKLEVQGTLARPQIKGLIQTQTGKLFLPQGVMNIRECWIRFFPDDPLIPHLQIKAETTVRDYRIFVRLSGRLGDLAIEFSSIPSLGQEDILMLLMTGATRQELQSSAGEKLKETGSFILMQQFLNSVGLGDYLSAQVTEESATITVTPPNWNGFAIQGKVAKEGQMRFRLIYRVEYP